MNGYNTKLLILNKFSGKRNTTIIIKKCLTEFNPKLICFTAVATGYQFIAEVAKQIKHFYPQIYLLLGGPHASLNPKRVLLDNFDAVCVGEGEYATLELVSQLEKELQPLKIPNLWIKLGSNSNIEENPSRPFLQDLNCLPFPDRKMWLEWLEGANPSRCSVLLGRGCPFQCTYCCNHALRKLASGKYVRFRTPNNVISELETIVADFPAMRDIYFEIETIGANIEWAMQFCEALKSFNKKANSPFSFGVNVRVTPNMNMESLFIKFQESNFKYINIGLESGSERIRREILRRNYSNQDIINAVNIAQKHGLKVRFYNILGIPDENVADLQETIAINKLCQPDWHETSIFFPYPGTGLHALCQERGLIPEQMELETERVKAILNIPNYSNQLLQRYYDWFDYYVYKGKRPIYNILAKVIGNKLRRNMLANYLYGYFMRFPFLRIFNNVLRMA
jgi:radical SAM superfamily enzyme YgiQ (UPF0313 family)